MKTKGSLCVYFFFSCFRFIFLATKSSFDLFFPLQCKSKCTPSWTPASLRWKDRLGSGSYSLSRMVPEGGHPCSWLQLLAASKGDFSILSFLGETVASAECYPNHKSSAASRGAESFQSPPSLPPSLSYPVATLLLPLSCLPTCRLRESHLVK